jgi:hypothetical protein
MEKSLLSRPPYLFLIGVGRSGTTVLRKSLGLHPRIYYTGTENQIVTDVLGAAFSNCTLPERARMMLVTQPVYDRIFERALNELLWQDPEKISDCIRTASFAMPPELPAYLLQVFPKACILHLVRNGIQVIASRQLHPFFQHMPFEEHCTRWARAFQFYQWGQAQGTQYHLFRHEWLHEESTLRAELGRVYAWLDISWDEAPLQNMLSRRYHPTRHPGETASTQQGYAEMSPAERDALEQTRTRRWQFWSETERVTFESICGEAMRGFGYPIPWRETQAATPARTSFSLRRTHPKTLFQKFGRPR